MKKALSLVLALAMVLSMGVIGFAADYTATTYTVTIGDTYEDEDGIFVDIDVDITDDKGVNSLEVAATNALGESYGTWLVETNPMEHKYTLQLADTVTEGWKVDDFEVAYITITTKDSDSAILDQDTYKVEYVAPEEVQDYVVAQMAAAYAAHSTTVKLDASQLDDQTLYVADWKYITNTYKDLWANTSAFLGMDLEVTLDNTIYSIPMADIIWYKNDVDFSIYSNVVDEDGYNLIRKLTGRHQESSGVRFRRHGLPRPDC